MQALGDTSQLTIARTTPTSKLSTTVAAIVRQTTRRSVMFCPGARNIAPERYIAKLARTTHARARRKREPRRG
jgi:hypothetical protein